MPRIASAAPPSPAPPATILATRRPPARDAAGPARRARTRTVPGASTATPTATPAASPVLDQRGPADAATLLAAVTATAPSAPSADLSEQAVAS